MNLKFFVAFLAPSLHTWTTSYRIKLLAVFLQLEVLRPVGSEFLLSVLLSMRNVSFSNLRKCYD